MRRLWILGAIGLCGFLSADVDEKQLVQEFKSLIKIQENLDEKIAEIKVLLGLASPLDDVSVWLPTQGLEQGVQEQLKAGREFLAKRNIHEAKEAFQEAWEKAPDHPATNFNLGLTYAHEGRERLAKRFLKAAIDQDQSQQAPNRNLVLAYLRGESKLDMLEEPSNPLETVKTQLTNLQKEAGSLRKASHLSKPEMMREVSSVLEKMKELIAEDKELTAEFYLYITDSYAGLEMYPEALATLESYEQAMDGKVLPDGFFSKKLDLEQKLQDLEKRRELLWAKEIDADVQFKLQEDIEELKVFATQIEEFVNQANLEDPDFQTICNRLGEYRWGNKPNRHVLVLSRYQEVLYSSLEGTVPIERYQDTRGVPFLKEILQTPSSDMPLKKVAMMPVELQANGQVTPYVILYTYIPKHQAYIVVRLNEEQIL